MTLRLILGTALMASPPQARRGVQDPRRETRFCRNFVALQQFAHLRVGRAMPGPKVQRLPK